MNSSLKVLALAIAASTITGVAAFATSIDLSGASTSTLINAPGGSFAQRFNGQTVSGQALTGSPSNPLSLQAAGTLQVAFFNGANTILPQPGNQAPLAILLDNLADSISWTMGFGNPPSSVTIDFFATDGSLVHTLEQSILDGYNSYSYSGFGAFAGLAISNNDDPAGLRYYNFEYSPAMVVDPVPDAGSTSVLLGAGLLGLVGIRRARK